MRVCIIYVSFHHGNTKKLVDAITTRYGFDAFELKEAEHVDFTTYDVVGFASGIYYAKMNIQLTDFIATHHHEIKNSFAMVTCGMKRRKQKQFITDFFKLCEINLLGIYTCRGFDTYGPLKYIGGIARKHPNASDIQQAYNFIDTILSK
ncbi:hypothetical protein A4S06_04670 [Erysipelotrichaceae bacterium MTC7]|nr:hypothetical protein A4S06_04670 [Erysipelotrichaceae bacterium MTC7]